MLGQKRCRQLQAERPIKAQILDLQVELAETQLGLGLTVSVVDVAVGDVGQSDQQRQTLCAARRKTLGATGRGCLRGLGRSGLSLSSAQAGKIEHALGIANQPNDRVTHNDPPDLKLLSEERHELEPDLQVSGADKGVRGKSRIVGQGHVLQPGADPTPQADVDVSNLQRATQGLLGLGQQPVFIGLDQTVEIRHGKRHQAADQEQQDQTTEHQFSHVSRLSVPRRQAAAGLEYGE